MHLRPVAIAAATTALLAVPLVVDRIDQSNAARSLSQVESKAAQARAQEGVLTSQITAFSDKIRAVQSRLSPIEARLTTLQGELDGLRTRRKELTSALEAEQKRLDALIAKLERQRTALAGRLSSAYRRGDTSVLQVLLQSGSVSTALAAQENLERVVVNDQGLIAGTQDSATQSERSRNAITQTRSEVWKTEKRVASAEAEVRVAFNRVNAERINLVAARNARAKLLSSVKFDRRELEAEARGLRARSAALSARIQSASSALPASVPVGGNGRLAWPVQGPVVSPFGPRWGRMHEGVDIAVGTGVPIGSSGSGTVIVAGWVGGYGNLVVVSHGGSLSTAYAHMSRIGVRTGQRVSTGDVLGAVGCTGHCFGPHVHFEVRVNGGAVNPLPYL